MWMSIHRFDFEHSVGALGIGITVAYLHFQIQQSYRLSALIIHTSLSIILTNGVADQYLYGYHILRRSMEYSSLFWKALGTQRLNARYPHRNCYMPGQAC